MTEQPQSITSLLTMTGQLFVVKAIQIGLIMLLAIVALRVSDIMAGRARRRIEQPDQTPARQARLQTLLRAGLNIVRIIVLATAALMILAELGVDLTPVLASVGVATLAVSLGAQTLIKDFIGGLLILIEDQYRVGDTVQIGTSTGTVEQINLRATHLRDTTGRLVIVPNGDVRVVANAGLDWARAIVDLSFPLDADIGRARDVLQAAVAQMKSDEAVASHLLEVPTVAPWHSLTESAVQMRLSARTTPNKQYDVARHLRTYALDALTREGIELAGATKSPP